MFFYPTFLSSTSWSLDLPQIFENFGASYIHNSLFCDVTLSWHLNKKQRWYRPTNIDIKTILWNTHNITFIREIMTMLYNTSFCIVFRISSCQYLSHISTYCLFQLFPTFRLLWIYLISQEIMGLLASAVIWLILAYCKIYTFITLISDFPLHIVASVNWVVLCFANISSSAVCCILLICVDESLTSSSSSIL